MTVFKRVDELPVAASVPADALVPVEIGGVLSRASKSQLTGVIGFNRFDVTASPFNADPTGVEDPTAAFVAADAAAALVGGTVYVPKGTYTNGSGWSYAQSSNVTLEGDGAGSVMYLCHHTRSGTPGAAIPFTAPAAKGAYSISIPASGLTNEWLRISSVVNCQSTDAGIDQLGDRASDRSFFAEFVQVKTGSVGTAVLYRGTEFAYSNTPGADSGSFTTSVARQVTFNNGGGVRNIKFLGVASGQTEIALFSWCKDFVIEDSVIYDTNDQSAYAISFEYCLDITLNARVVGKRTSVSLSQQNPVHISSCTNVRGGRGLRVFGGYQGVDVTYPVQDNTYRGGPSIDCGADFAVAEGYEVDGFTSHGGCLRTTFRDCEARGGASGSNGFRIRSRGDRVIGGMAMGFGAAGAGVKVHEFALFDCDVSGVDVRGFSNNIELDYAATTMAAVRALLGGSSATVRNNKLSDAAANGIALLDSPALATMIGPRIDDNDILSSGGDGIDIGAYVNGVVLGTNRITGVPAGGRGVRYTTNTKRLNIGTQHIYNVNAAGFAIGGASVVNMMTDLTTFPAGNAEAQLYIAPQYTDAATPYTGIRRGDAAYLKATTPGNGADAEIPVVLTVSGNPDNVVYAPLGSICTDKVSGIPYSKTSGADAASGWVKSSST